VTTEIVTTTINRATIKEPIICALCEDLPFEVATS